MELNPLGPTPVAPVIAAPVPPRLLQGIHHLGFLKFCQEELKLIKNNVNILFATALSRERVWHSAASVRSRGYLEKDKWFAKVYPNQLTGYDVCACIKLWLKEQKIEEKSVCEVLKAGIEITKEALTDFYVKHDPSQAHESNIDKLLVENTGHHCLLCADLRRKYNDEPARKEYAYVRPGMAEPAVGEANVFLSHTQAEHPGTTCVALGYALLADGRAVVRQHIDTYVWLDYTSLRQDVKDFEINQVLSIVKEIGCTLAVLPKEPQVYLTRLFCIFELYATILNDSKLYLLPTNSCFALPPQCCSSTHNVVDSLKATSRDPDATKRITAFIDKVGRATFDQSIAAQINRAYYRKNVQIFFASVCCPIFCLCQCLVPCEAAPWCCRSY
jgi:hypothetical protein